MGKGLQEGIMNLQVVTRSGIQKLVLSEKLIACSAIETGLQK